MGSVSELVRAVAEAVSCRSSAAEVRVRSQAISVSGGRSGIWTGFCPSTRVFGCNYLAPYSLVYRNVMTSVTDSTVV
jgi:hypothetical protein